MATNPVTVSTPRGELRGEAIGRDPRGLVLVMIRRETAPAWFQAEHASKVPHVWYREQDVRRD